MKVLCVAIIGILGVLASACVTGDEITTYVIEPDEAVSFHIYRSNLASDQTGESGKQDLDSSIQKLEEKQADLFAKLAKANAQEVKVAVLRRISPASVMITGQIPTLTDFVSYLGDECECTPISRERIRGFHCELSQEPSAENSQSEADKPDTGSHDEMRFSLTEGKFTRAQGFNITHDGRSAVLEMDALDKALKGSTSPFTLSLEWQIPEAQ
jgi:hypothetical protein